MGQVKDPDERKSITIQFRVTPKEKELLKKFQHIEGYGSISRFILETLLEPQTTRRLAKRAKEQIKKEDSLFFVQKEVEDLTNQIKGIAKNYNQVVTIMNTLARTSEKSSTRRLIIKKMVVLNDNTKQVIKILKEIKDMINKQE